jgi:hypothetical protein
MPCNSGGNHCFPSRPSLVITTTRVLLGCKDIGTTMIYTPRLSLTDGPKTSTEER